jgi:hypothetical protein
MIVHDNTGGVYKVSKIGNKASGYTLDPQKYLAYSSVRWFLEWYSHICPSINVYLGLHTNYVCLEYVWFILCHAECTTRLSHPGKSSIHGRCRQKDSSNGDRISSWPFKTSMPGRDWCARCPVGCYIVGCALALFMAVFAVEYWDAELRWYGVLLACAVALVFYPPVCHLHQNCLRLVFRCSPFSFSILAGNCLRNIEFQDKH